MEQKTKQKQRRFGVGNGIKMTSNVWSVTKIESRHEALWQGKKM